MHSERATGREAELLAGDRGMQSGPEAEASRARARGPEFMSLWGGAGRALSDLRVHIDLVHSFYL